MNTGVILGIVIIILSLCLVYIGIMGLMGKATNKKIAALPEEIRPKAARIYGIGSLVTAAGAAVLGLHSMRTLIGFDIPEYIGLIGIGLGIVIIILSLCLVYIGIMGLMGKATNKKIAELPEEIRPKAARIYGVGSLVTAAGAAILGLHSMRTLIGFDIPEYIGLIGIGLGLAINISTQRIRK